MHVRDIIQSALNLCNIGTRDEQEYKAVYLPYLNQVHHELFNYTAASNVYAHISKHEVDLTEGISPEDEKVAPFLIKKVVLDDGSVLLQKSYDWLLTADPLRQYKAAPIYYAIHYYRLYVYPAFTGRIHLIQTDPPHRLTLDTTSDELPYPESYHHVLVDGLSYYLSVDEFGDIHTNRQTKAAYTKYEQGKRQLYSYLLNAFGTQDESTYTAF